MAKNLSINIDDDVTRVIRKISQLSDTDITLVLPKGSLLFFDIINLKLLKKHADDLGKEISILTMDPKGQQKSLEAGFALKSFEDLKRAGPSMDAMPRKRPPVLSRPAAAAVVVPEVAAPIIQKQEPIVSQPRVQMLNPVAEKRVRAARAPRSSRRVKNFLILSSIIGIVLLVLLTLVILPSADLTIYVHSQPLNKDLQINLDTAAPAPDVDKLTLPVKAINNEENINHQFEATGQINLGNKASGKIQVFNFTGKELRLNAATTTLTAGQNTYHFTADVPNIKPTRYFANTKDIDPASLVPPADIIADQPGENSNLPAGTRIEVNNQVLGAQPTVLYGNSQAISGGSTRLSSIVTQTDIDNAAKALKDLALGAARQELLSSQGLTLPDTGSATTIKSITFDKKVGDQTVTFNGNIDLQISGAAYNPTQLKKMVQDRLLLTSGDKVLAADKEKIITELKSFDAASGKGFMVAHYQGALISKIDKDQIASQIPGKSANDLREFLLSNPDIDGVDIAFSPFWVKNVPKYSGKINISVQAQ